jgi:hypothetical protein
MTRHRKCTRRCGLLLTHIAVVLFATVGVGTPASGQTDGRTVAEVLADCGCLIADMPAALLEKRVAHVQQLIYDQGFVVAFVTSPNDRARGFEVIAGNVQASTWKHAAFPAAPENREWRFQEGQLWRISRTQPFILMELRVTTAGIATSILDRDLTRVGITGGRVTSILPGGLVMFERAQPHFAPTHPLMLAVLDTATALEREIYPAKPYDRVRRETIAQERERYAALGPDWCREKNHHCDPERFDSTLASPPNLAINLRTNSMAFGVEYGAGVIVVCTGIQRLATISCHESPIEAWRRAFPEVRDAELTRRAAEHPTRVNWS